MPSGITAPDRPCRARPATIGHSELVSAHITEPMIISTAQARRTRRLPYISPSRPKTGMPTAAASSVEVTAQDAFASLVCSSDGNSGRIGTSRVCISETTMPPAARTATISPLFGALLMSGSLNMYDTHYVHST
jgi:hypothetical protein